MALYPANLNQKLKKKLFSKKETKNLASACTIRFYERPTVYFDDSCFEGDVINLGIICNLASHPFPTSTLVGYRGVAVSGC
jgi:hypothetical protein